MKLEMVKIRKARPEEVEQVIHFYHSLIDEMQNSKFSPGWEKNVYPASDYIKDSISKGELFLAEHAAKIAGAMVINHEYNESYNTYAWENTPGKEQISVIHALGVHPEFSGRGVGKQMVSEAINMCRENSQSVIRLDVLKGNLPAERLYQSMGFEYRTTIPMFYEDTGWTDYELFELIISGGVR